MHTGHDQSDPDGRRAEEPRFPDELRPVCPATEHDKNQTYGWYAILHPADNHGQMQTCELDHLISLELGGADTLDNIWPQCGPGGVPLDQEYFKEKDTAENYLARQVKDGAMDLADAQHGIATDWTQYLDAARAACPGGRC